MTLNSILQAGMERGASDILIIAGLPVSYKINGSILRDGPRLLPDDTAALAEELYRLAGQRGEVGILLGEDALCGGLGTLLRRLRGDNYRVLGCR